MSSTVVTLNGTSSATAVPELVIVKVARQLLGDRRDVFVEVPGKAGSYAFAEEPGDRFVVLQFDLQAGSFADRRDAVRRLAAWADTPAGSVPLAVDDEPDRYSEAVLVGRLDVDEWLTRGAGEIEYRVGPYALANDPTTETLVLLTSPASDTFTAADELTAYPVLELTPLDGTMTGFTLSMNGDTLTWSGLVILADTLTVSAISATVTQGANDDVNLVGAFNVGALDMADVDGSFPLVVPGTNALDLSWTGTATGISVAITWRRRYR